MSIEIKSDINNLELFSENYPFRLPLRIRNFEKETEFAKFSKNCERIIRTSMEYKLWRNYIVDILGINECAITKENVSEVSVEVHHHIPSLYILIKTIINKNIEKEIEFSTFDICLESIQLHFENKVGYVVLINSIHEKFHNGFLNIPTKMVKGNYKEFLSEYNRYIDEDDLEVINSRLNIVECSSGWSRDNYPGL